MADDPLLTAARALMQAVLDGEERDGGLITRQTLQLASLLRIEIDRAERKAVEPSIEQRTLGRAYQLAGHLIGEIEWPHLVPLLDMLSGDTSRLDETFPEAPVRLT